MASLKTKFSVGLFLIIGMTVIVIGIIWLGMSNYFEKGRLFVAYFDESVQGLDRDSPVKYRGVSIGRVHRIGVAPDERLIEVVLKIESEIQPERQTGDIVAQLKSVGITGLMFVELERKGTNEPDLTPSLDFTPSYPVVPTRPSEISKIFQGIEDVFNLFRDLDTETISNQLTQALRKINQAIDEARLAALARDVRDTLQRIQALVDTNKMNLLLNSMSKTSSSLNQMAVNADGGVTEIRDTVADLKQVINTSGDNMENATADLKKAAEQVNRSMQTAAGLLQNTDRQMDALLRQVLATLLRIDQASTTLNQFLDRIADQPSQLIFSAPVQEKPSAP